MSRGRASTNQTFFAGEGNICSVSVSFVRVSSQISPRRAKKDSDIPSPGRTRSVKCPTPGPTKTIKSPPHDALPPPPSAGITITILKLRRRHHWSAVIMAACRRLSCSPVFHVILAYY